MSDRKMWKRWHSCTVLLICALLGACTAPWPAPERISPVYEKGVLRETPSDADLFGEGMSYLGGSGKDADYEKARAAFDRLLKTHPGSKWQNLTEVLIRVIDDVYACRGKSNTDGSATRKGYEDLDRIQRENEQLKKNNRMLLDKLNSETSKLIQENEQLKKDIQLLKSLEVQLEKRDKMLR